MRKNKKIKNKKCKGLEISLNKKQDVSNQGFLEDGFLYKWKQLKIPVPKKQFSFFGPSFSNKGQLKIQTMTNQRFLKLGFLNKRGQLKIPVQKKQFSFFGPSFSSKGQLKIQEMAFMLVALVLFFVLVGLFVIIFIVSNITKEAENIREDKTIFAVREISNSPELRCSSYNSHCVDELKLISLINKKEYSLLWPFSSLKVLRQSGFGKQEKDLIICTKENYPLCDLFPIFDLKKDNERATSSFISLCRKINTGGNQADFCEIAKIIAGTSLPK